MTGTLMPAVVIVPTGPRGDWNSLALQEVTRPVPGPGEVLVQVEACSVNRADLLQRRGLYPPPPGASPILGLDFSGFVIDVAPDIQCWHPGDRVFGVVPGGGYGRYLVTPGDQVVPVPSKLSFAEAAAAAEVFFVAYLNLFQEAGMQPGEAILIHGGGSGVGTAAIQLAKQASFPVLVTAGTREKLQRCLRLGADFGMNYEEEDFEARTLDFTQGRGVDVILDWIGAPYLEKHLRLLKTGGRLVIIGLMGGHEASIQLAPLLTKRLRLMGSVLRSRSPQEKASLTRSFSQHVLPLLDSGAVRPVIDRVYPIRAVEDAHRYLRDGSHFGKVVLVWGDA